jgi:hypothetical protein
MVETSFFTSWSWRQIAMYRAMDCEEKLAARADHASCAVLEKMTMPCTASVEVDMMARGWSHLADATW